MCLLREDTRAPPKIKCGRVAACPFVYEPTRRATPHTRLQMVKQGRGGAIINMSSVNGIMAIPTITGYNASKGGVNNLTR